MADAGGQEGRVLVDGPDPRWGGGVSEPQEF